MSNSLVWIITPPLISPNKLHCSVGANPHYQFSRGNESPPNS